MLEYALLAALVAVVGIAALTALDAALGASYAQWDTAQQDLWETPAPAPR